MPLALAAAAVLAVSACGGGNGAGSASSTGGQTAANCSNTSINIGTNGDASNINPILAVDLDGRWRTDLLFDPLVQVDPKTLQPKPALATSWDVSADGRTYTFHLHQGVKFQNGQPFTAADVAFTVDQMLQPGYTGPHQIDWARLTGAADVIHGKASTPSGLQVVDPYT